MIVEMTLTTSGAVQCPDPEQPRTASPLALLDYLAVVITYYLVISAVH